MCARSICKSAVHVPVCHFHEVCLEYCLLKNFSVTKAKVQFFSFFWLILRLQVYQNKFLGRAKFPQPETSAELFDIQMEISDQWCHQASKLGSVVFNTFINGIDSGVECSLRKFVDYTKLSGVVDSPEGQDAIQRELNKIEKKSHGNLMGVNKAKYKVLCLSWDNVW